MSTKISIGNLLETETFPSLKTVSELSVEQTTLVAFLRHNGCTFCRETIKDLAALKNTTIVLVHMGSKEGLNKLLIQYCLIGAQTIFDPEKKLYRAQGLKKGTLWQLFGIKNIIRVLKNLRLGAGKLDGDGFQMPGIFTIKNGKIVSEFRHQYAGDKPDYCEISK